MAGALKDGEYSVDADHFSAKLTSGGSSKVKIECQKVIVKNGKATAWINFSSSKYDKSMGESEWNPEHISCKTERRRGRSCI